MEINKEGTLEYNEQTMDNMQDLLALVSTMSNDLIQQRELLQNCSEMLRIKIESESLRYAMYRALHPNL